jgi:hypothetical protein
VHSVFCEFTIKSNTVVSYHHNMAMIRCLEDDKIERQLKCKICDVGLCILGASRSTIQRRDSVTTQSVTKKKGMYIEFYSIKY